MFSLIYTYCSCNSLTVLHLHRKYFSRCIRPFSVKHVSSLTYIRISMNQAEYEFPVSPPDDHEASAASSKSPVTSEPNNMASIPTPSTVTSASPNQRHSVEKVRRDRNPPKNPNGDIYCDHQECSTDPPTFRRPCEWNKHMDRHERPYKCVATGCEMSQGFTYSGGLLRHQREVHKMHLAAKEPLYCPFPGCNRGTGPGFTRKENLEEHKRRRHLGEPAELLNGHARKRKRLMTPQPDINDYDDPDEGENPNDVDVTNHPYVQAFSSLKWLENTPRLLRRTTSSERKRWKSTGYRTCSDTFRLRISMALTRTSCRHQHRFRDTAVSRCLPDMVPRLWCRMT